MGPADTMSSLKMESNSNSTNLVVPKLCDDRSNWTDYEPRIQWAMGSKGIWRHIEGTAIVPVPYMILSGLPVLPDGKTQATEEQVESKEVKLADYEKREYLAQHIILSTTSPCLGDKIKNLITAKEMWELVKMDVTTKSTLHLIDAEDQLAVEYIQV